MELGTLDVARGSTVLDNCGGARSAEARKACYANLPSRVGAIGGSMEAAGRACHELAPPGGPHDSCVKTFSLGLHERSRCTLLVTRAEQQACRWTFDLRESPEADAATKTIPRRDTTPGLNSTPPKMDGAPPRAPAAPAG